MHTAQAAPAEEPSELSQVRAAALAAGSTYEALMAEHGGALVALEKVAPLLGLSAGRATHLAGRGGNWQRVPSGGNVRCALDQAMADDAAALHDGAEIAFFPPVTGG